MAQVAVLQKSLDMNEFVYEIAMFKNGVEVVEGETETYYKLPCLTNHLDETDEFGLITRDVELIKAYPFAIGILDEDGEFSALYFETVGEMEREWENIVN